jgi:hypothetical protein
MIRFDIHGGLSQPEQNKYIGTHFQDGVTFSNQQIVSFSTQ